MRLIRFAVLLSLGSSLCLPAAARADDKKVRLYAELAHGEKPVAANPNLDRALSQVLKSCWYSEYSRGGPPRRDVVKCNQAEKRLIAFGVAAANAGLAALDREETGAALRERLYDVAARNGDLSTVKALGTALERLGKAPRADIKTADRQGEGLEIESTLARLTFANIGERAPWEGEITWNAIPAAAPWQAWIAGHENSPPSAWLADRITEARAHAADSDLRTAFIAARFLAMHGATQKEGIAALKAVLHRKGATEEQRAAIQEALENVPTIPVEKSDTLRSLS